MDRIFTHLNVITDVKVSAKNIQVKVQQELCDFDLKSQRIMNIYIPFPV